MFLFLSREDPRYPSSLKEIEDPPSSLWYEGELEHLSAELSVAIVGARRCTAYGEKIAFGLARDLARAGVTVVSGLALGIDAAAHRGALEGKGSTIAVLGCGIDVVYPLQNGGLYEEIARKGLVLTEFPPGTGGRPENFPKRNRIVSGLSRGVVVVEAREKSGALITVKWALEQGKEVFAVPGNITSPLSAGTHRLIQNGAKLVTRADDILEELHYPVNRLFQERAPIDEDEVSVIGLLSNGPRHVDELVDRLGLPVEKISSLLVQLELTGRVRSLPGGRYEKKEDA